MPFLIQPDSHTREPAGIIRQRRSTSLSGQSQVELLRSISFGILKREQSKLLAQLLEKTPKPYADIVNNLYGPEEQRTLLSARILRSPAPVAPQLPTAELTNTYAEMVETFMRVHPFLDGSSLKPANAVFGADIAVWALFSTLHANFARQTLKLDPRLISGVLFDLYIDQITKSLEPALPLSDVGLLYESLKVQVGARQLVSLEVVREALDDAPIEASFDVNDRPSDPATERSYGPFRCIGETDLELRSRLTGVFVDAPIWITLGDGAALEIEAPTEITAETIVLAAKQVFVLPGAGESPDPKPGVILEAREAEADSVERIVVTGATLSVSWPDAHQYPWTSYAYEPEPEADPDIELLRLRLKSILTAFRANNNGMLARSSKKIESKRMMRNRRDAFLLGCLLADKILFKFDGGTFYGLNPDVMADLLSMDYTALQKRKFTTQCDEYLHDVLARFQS